MGYSLELRPPFAESPPGTTPTVGTDFNGWMMGFVREFLREVGAVRSQPGYEQAMHLTGFEPGPLSVPIEWFIRNGGDIISADQAAFMAARVRAGMTSDAMEVFNFLDDAPEPAVAAQWLEEFAVLNERAAQGNGYRVY